MKQRAVFHTGGCVAALMLACFGISACEGRVEGSASTVLTSHGRPTDLFGTPVYLLPATPEVMGKVAAACDSAIEYGRDDSERLVPTLARAMTYVDSRNQFAFESVERGRYFVVAQQVGWAAVEVGRGTARTSVRAGGAGACTAVGAPGWFR